MPQKKGNWLIVRTNPLLSLSLEVGGARDWYGCIMRLAAFYIPDYDHNSKSYCLITFSVCNFNFLLQKNTAQTCMCADFIAHWYICMTDNQEKRNFIQFYSHYVQKAELNSSVQQNNVVMRVVHQANREFIRSSTCIPIMYKKFYRDDSIDQ